METKKKGHAKEICQVIIIIIYINEYDKEYRIRKY